MGKPFRPVPLRGYALPKRRAPWRPLHAQVARYPVAGVGVDAMVRAFDFYDRVFGEGKYREPDDDDSWQDHDGPKEWSADDSIPF